MEFSDKNSYCCRLTRTASTLAVETQSQSIRRLFRLEINWAEVKLLLLCASFYCYFLLLFYEVREVNK
jgi:hypothetical protein